jgi:hypothetical protein
LEPAGDVRGDDQHMRAAFHPDGRHVYITTLTQASDSQYAIHLRTFHYNASNCSLGPLLASTRMEADTASNTRAYGLEVHSSGRWLYQSTASVRNIHRFQLGDDRLPVPNDSYDVTQGGSIVCAQSRRLALHPDGRTLYSNCNNADAGRGVELALQAWVVGPNGALAFSEHHVLETMDGGISDPVLHPSGRWLYQPVGTPNQAAPRGPGAYVLIFAVAPDGSLRLHDTTPIRVVTPEDSVQDVASTQIFPTTFIVHPDGRSAYVTVHVSLGDFEAFPHEIVRYQLERDGGQLVEVDRRPAALPTTFSSHHGGALVNAEGTFYLYSYLTDYDTTRGGVLQQYRIGAGHELIPLDPPYVGTGLRDARQPIVAR